MRRWPLLLWLLPLIPLLVLLISMLERPQRQQIAVVPEESSTSEPLRLDSGWFGSPLIQLRAELPVNSSMGLGVELRRRPVLGLTPVAVLTPVGECRSAVFGASLGVGLRWRWWRSSS